MRAKVDSLSTKISESIYFWIPIGYRVYHPSTAAFQTLHSMDALGSRPVLHEFGSSGDDSWFCMTVLSDSRAAAAARPDES